MNAEVARDRGVVDALDGCLTHGRWKDVGVTQAKNRSIAEIHVVVESPTTLEDVVDHATKRVTGLLPKDVLQPETLPTANAVEIVADESANKTVPVVDDVSIVSIAETLWEAPAAPKSGGTPPVPFSSDPSDTVPAVRKEGPRESASAVGQVAWWIWKENSANLSTQRACKPV